MINKDYLEILQLEYSLVKYIVLLEKVLLHADLREEYQTSLEKSLLYWENEYKDIVDRREYYYNLSK